MDDLGGNFRRWIFHWPPFSFSLHAGRKPDDHDRTDHWLVFGGCRGRRDVLSLVYRPMVRKRRSLGDDGDYPGGRSRDLRGSGSFFGLVQGTGLGRVSLGDLKEPHGQALGTYCPASLSASPGILNYSVATSGVAFPTFLPGQSGISRETGRKIYRIIPWPQLPLSAV